MDSNHRPRAYQARALTSWAISPYDLVLLIHLIPFVTFVTGGDDGIRTHDPLLAGQVLSQLSYTPIMRYPLTGCWHRPIFPSRFQLSIFGTAQLNFCVRNGNRWTLCVSGTNYYFNSVTENWTTNLLDRSPSDCYLAGNCHVLHRKEVIQPHLPIRLPCYDLTPIIEPTFDCCLLAVSTQASGDRKSVV